MGLSRFIAKGSPAAWDVILCKLPWQSKQSFARKTWLLYPVPVSNKPQQVQHQKGWEVAKGNADPESWSETRCTRWMRGQCPCHTQTWRALPGLPWDTDQSSHKRRNKEPTRWKEAALTQHLRAQQEAASHAKRELAAPGRDFHQHLFLFLGHSFRKWRSLMSVTWHQIDEVPGNKRWWGKIKITSGNVTDKEATWHGQHGWANSKG